MRSTTSSSASVLVASICSGPSARSYPGMERALAISHETIAENVPAILDGRYLGQETGTAVADVLFGDANPAGKLPITVPRSTGQLPDYYYQKPSAKREYLGSTTTPLYPFG